MEVILYIVIFIIVSGLIMVGTNILYDLAAAIIPIAAVVMIIIGVISLILLLILICNYILTI